MRPDVPRSRTLVELIIPIGVGLTVWAWYGLIEAMLVAVTAIVIVLSHMARRWAREQLVYPTATDHADHATARGGSLGHRRDDHVHVR